MGADSRRRLKSSATNSPTARHNLTLYAAAWADGAICRQSHSSSANIRHSGRDDGHKLDIGYGLRARDLSLCFVQASNCNSRLCEMPAFERSAAIEYRLYCSRGLVPPPQEVGEGTFKSTNRPCLITSRPRSSCTHRDNRCRDRRCSSNRRQRRYCRASRGECPRRSRTMAPY